MAYIPTDPFILLSFVNTQLRDRFSDLEAFCEAYEADETAIKEKLSAIDYFYDREQNRFI